MQTISRPKPSNNGKAPKPYRDGKGPLSSKGGSVAAAVVTAVLAGLVIVVFLNQYKDNVNSDSVPTPVLVADKQIPVGASGDSIGENEGFKSTEVPKNQLKEGAITDAAVLKGKVATTDILPGQQLTSTDFKPAGSGVITKLDSEQRAVTLPLDKAHGMIGQLRVGDHVDVLAGFLVETGGGRPRPVMRTVAQDVLVLSVPKAAAAGAAVNGSSRPQEIGLRVSNVSAPKVSFAAEFGKVWLALRPANGKDVSKRSLVTIESLLFSQLSGTTPLRASRGT